MWNFLQSPPSTIVIQSIHDKIVNILPVGLSEAPKCSYSDLGLAGHTFPAFLANLYNFIAQFCDVWLQWKGHYLLGVIIVWEM